MAESTHIITTLHSTARSLFSTTGWLTFFWHAHVSMQYAYLWVHVYGVIHAYVCMKARG